MMKEPTPRVIKLLQLDNTQKLVNMVTGVLLGVAIGSEVGGPAGFFGGLVLSWLYIRIMSNLVGHMLKMHFYKGDWNALSQESEYAANFFAARAAASDVKVDSPSTMTFSLTIEKTPEKPMGRYKDVEFFEWLDIKKVDGGVVRFEFLGTVDLNGPVPELKNGQLLLPPGLIYQVVTQ